MLQMCVHVLQNEIIFYWRRMYSLYTYMYQVIYINVSATGVYTSGSPENQSLRRRTSWKRSETCITFVCNIYVHVIYVTLLFTCQFRMQLLESHI